MNKENINKDLRSLQVEGFASKDNAWAKLQQRIAQAESTQEEDTPVVELYPSEAKKKSGFRWQYAAAALAAMFVVAFMLYTPEDLVNVSAGYASIEQCELPDGSVVHLNASSKLSFDANAWDSERQVWLEGEAEFEVAKGSKFTVKSQSGEVKVLGTSFNIYDRQGVYEVSCLTGKVSVENDKHQEIIIPGQQVKQDEAGKFIKTSFVGKPAGWVDGEYYFDEVEALRVFTILENTYGIAIDHSKWEDAEQSIYAGPVVTSSLPKALRLIGGEAGSLPIEFIDLGNNKYEVLPLSK